MSSDESDVEVNEEVGPQTAKTKKKIFKPKVFNEQQEVQELKKLTTKEMVINALSAYKGRKGISLYAIKKHMHDNFNVDVEKINYLIKKSIKESVEAGKIIQTKGIGASGSFRLAPDSKLRKKASKKTKTPKEGSEKGEKPDKPKKASSKVAREDSKSTKKVKDNKPKSKKAKLEPKDLKKTKLTTTNDSPKPGSSKMKTQKKKNSMMKRKSIGSIIKPPKMKPAKK